MAFIPFGFWKLTGLHLHNNEQKCWEGLAQRVWGGWEEKKKEKKKEKKARRKMKGWRRRYSMCLLRRWSQRYTDNDHTLSPTWWRLSKYTDQAVKYLDSYTSFVLRALSFRAHSLWNKIIENTSKCQIWALIWAVLHEYVKRTVSGRWSPLNTQCSWF